MDEQPKSIKRGRLPLFDPDAARRHYQSKYVLAGVWRGLNDVDREQRIRDVIRSRSGVAAREETDEIEEKIPEGGTTKH